MFLIRIVKHGYALRICLFVLILTSQVLVGCTQTKNSMNIEQIQLYQPDKKYSYVAPEERTSIILQNMNKLKKGMTSDQVIALLTAPDEAHLTYKSIKKATDKTDNMTGFRWYIC